MTFAGQTVAGANDVNGDGYADMITGSRSSDRATVFLGGPNGPTYLRDLPRPAGEPLPQFAEGVATAGDVNGDGYAEVLVAASGTARAWLYYGSPTGPAATGPTSFPGDAGSGFNVPTTLAHAGDVNGDGRSDFIIGAFNGNLVRVHYGSSDAGVSPVGLTINYPGGGRYAWSVASLGDLNGDGIADIIVAPALCTGYPVIAYRGSAAGLVTSPVLGNYTPPMGEQCLGSGLPR
jgi:hypothetical protein